MNKLLKVATMALAATLVLSLLAAPAALAAEEPATAAGHGEAGHGDAGHEAPSLFASPNFQTITTSVVTLVIFAGLLAVLGKYAWGPIQGGLIARETKIRQDIEAAERARAQADAARRQYEQQLETAEQRVRDLMAQAQADGQQLATRIKMQAQEESEEIKERAMREIEQSRRDAVDQIRSEAAMLATAVAEKILRREVNRDDQRRLVEESLNEFQAVGTGA